MTTMPSILMPRPDSIAANSSEKCPLSVESLRLMTSVPTPAIAAAAARLAAISRTRAPACGAGMLRVLARR